MKIPTAPALFSLTGLLVVAITVLAALHQPVPDVLITLAVVSASAGAGAAAPGAVGRPSFSSTPAAPVPDLGQLDGLTLPPATLTPAPVPAAAAPAAPAGADYGLGKTTAPAPAAAVPGWDHTETFPAITPAQIAADRAPQ